MALYAASKLRHVVRMRIRDMTYIYMTYINIYIYIYLHVLFKARVVVFYQI